MAWPPQLPPDGRFDDTDQATNHPSDHNVGADALAQLAERVIRGAADKSDLIVQYGTVTVTGDGSTYASADVVYDMPFDFTPITVATVASSASLWGCETGGNATTGFQVGIWRQSGATFTTSRTVHWIALGKIATEDGGSPNPPAGNWDPEQTIAGTASISTDSQGNFSVSFDEAFDSPPVVGGLEILATSTKYAQILATTESGFSGRVRELDGSQSPSWSGTLTYFARGPLTGGSPTLRPFEGVECWKNTNVTGIGATETLLCQAPFTPVAGQTYRISGRVPFRFGTAATSTILAYIKLEDDTTVARSHLYANLVANERDVLEVGGLWTPATSTPTSLYLVASTSASSMQTNAVSGGADPIGFSVVPIVNSAV